MSHGDSVTAGARGHAGHRLHRRCAGRRVRGRRAPALRRAVAPRGACTRRSASGCSRTSSTAAPGSTGDWTAANVVEELVESIRAQVGRVARHLRASPVASTPRWRRPSCRRPSATSSTCVFVDHGLLRSGEAEQVEKDFVAATGVDLVVVDARERFLSALAGVSDPEEKRKIIGREFIRVFEQAARDVVGSRRGRRPPGGVPRAGHALPRRRRVRRRHRRRQHQVAPQRRRPARRPAVQARRAAAVAVQGRGAPGRARARRARGDRLAPAVPRPRPRHPHRRRGDRRAAGRCCARPTRSPARS